MINAGAIKRELWFNAFTESIFTSKQKDEAESRGKDPKTKRARSEENLRKNTRTQELKISGNEPKTQNTKENIERRLLETKHKTQKKKKKTKRKEGQ